MVMARLKDLYKKELVAVLQKRFAFKSSMQVPRLEKIVINVGLGEMAKDPKLRDAVVVDIGLITGQRPVLAKAHKDISNFSVRKGDVIGCKVTLRDTRMYEFLDRLINVAIPRTKDFRGISPKSFDGYGNFTMGVLEHIIFPEVSYEKVMRIFGMNITIVTTSKNDEQCFELLKCFGMPFRN
jgi:large subunit ribosomal protein L5